tara:strand:+ start:769 stop:900 length:132 start_codon:yes stop_codon:yes gene_type:complete
MSKEVLFILIDVLERLKDTNDEITISEISKAITLLEKEEKENG